MATLETKWPNLANVASRLDPGGKIDKIAEILNLQNEALDDIPWVEGNLPTGTKTTVRTGIPAPTWRKLYGGVQPTKSTTAQVTDTCGMMEAYAEIDKALADLNGNTAEWRLSEEKPFIEGFNQELMTNIFYGSEATAPEKITGLSPRYNSLSASNAENIIDGAGTGTDNTSIWLVVWGENTVHGIYPKGSKVGLQTEDKGQVTIENADGSQGRMEAYRTHYRWDVGLCLRDWRYVVRICNIDKSDLTKDNATGADLTDLMTQAIELIPNLGMGRPTFYVSRRIRSFLRRQITNKVKNSSLTMEEVAGRKVVAFDSIPVRRVDALAADEARIT